MRIVECEELSYKGFSEAVKKLPLLEELEIAFNQHLSNKDSLEVVGQYCPLLKSLKYEKITDEDDDFDIEDEAFAFSVAETMSGLRRLKISSNVLTTDGVLAILDGCPLLECLDIQECRYLFLSFSLEKMCHERIKEYFRLPDFYAFCASDDDYYEDLLPENWNGSVYGDHNLSMMLKHD